MKLAFHNNYKIKSFFKYKDSLPKLMTSSVVYSFKCSNCSFEYIGSSIKNLSIRIDEHLGISPRTGRALARPLQSSVRNHRDTCDCIVTKNNFDILCKSNSEQELRITESIYIKLRKPVLNIEASSYPLYIF